MRLFHASQARRSASLRAAAARSAEARMEGPKMLSRGLVPMAEECASLAGIGKPLQLAAGRETDATVRGSSPDAYYSSPSPNPATFRRDRARNASTFNAHRPHDKVVVSSSHKRGPWKGA